MEQLGIGCLGNEVWFLDTTITEQLYQKHECLKVLEAVSSVCLSAFSFEPKYGSYSKGTPKFKAVFNKCSPLLCLLCDSNSTFMIMLNVKDVVVLILK